MQSVHRLAAVALALAIVPFARADEASKNAKIEQLFAAARLENVLNQMYALAQNQVQTQMTQITGVHLNTEQDKIYAEFVGKVMQALKAKVGWDQMRPVYAKLYPDAFSESDLDGMLAFYQSPAGQAMVAKTPDLMSAGSKAAQEKLTTAIPDLQALMQEYVPKLKAAGQPPAQQSQPGTPR